MEHEIDLKQIWDIIKKYWLLFVILPLLAALISGAISFYLIKPVYQSSTTLIVGKRADDTEEQSAKQFLDVLEANRLLAKTYGEIAKSRTVKEQVIDELKLGLTAEQLDAKITVSQVEETEILEITVTDTNPKLAAEIANVTVKKFSAAVIKIKKIDSVSIIDKAIAPTAPIKPNKSLNIMIAFLAGLVAALGLSVLLDYLDSTIRSSKEAEELMGLSVLGVILDYKYNQDYKKERSIREFNLKTLNSPKSPVAEDYRTLRTNIKFASVDNVVKHILFTSAGPREGKSSIVADLAVSMSQTGKNVLIVDADLRNPSQHKIFGLLNFTGLTTTLTDNVSAFTYIVKTPYEGLDILTSGPIPPNPAELLDSRRMKQILHEIAPTYEFILIDSPPVIALTDASILAQTVDGVILVLAEREVEREYALRAKEQLEKVKAKILGIVLNKAKVQSPKQDYYYYYENEDHDKDGIDDDQGEESDESSHKENES